MKKFLKYIVLPAIFIFPSFGFYYLGYREGIQWCTTETVYKAYGMGLEVGHIEGIKEAHFAFKRNGLKGVEKIKTKDGREIYKIEY